MPQKISNLANGAKVKDTGTLYFGKPLLFRVADKNHAGYPANSVTLITENIICLKSFDAIEPSNADSNRKSYGNNRYLHANLRQWANSDKAANAWFTAQHSADAKPTTAACANYNGYDTESGFLTGFSASFRAALLDTTRTIVKNTVTDGGVSETVTDKVFLASTTEVGLANENSIAEGTKLAIFSDDASRIAYPTAEAVANSNYTSTSFATNKGWYWWLSTPYAANSFNVRSIVMDGSLGNSNAYYGYWGVRPLCNLSSEILVSDTTDTDGAYTIVWNQPPPPPNGITTPIKIDGGKNATINWGASTDPNGNLAGYILERGIDGGGFSQIYKGVALTYTDMIERGWVAVQYRVKAYDTEGEESGYTTSAIKTVEYETVKRAPLRPLRIPQGTRDTMPQLPNGSFGQMSCCKRLFVKDSITGKMYEFPTTEDMEVAVKSAATDWKLLDEYKTAGTYTWIAPDLYGDGQPYEIGVFIIGGGGMGGVGIRIATYYLVATATGGGSGYTRTITMMVTPGGTAPVVVGAGGRSGVVSYTSAGVDGASSSFNGNTASGGYGGKGYDSNVNQMLNNGANGGQPSTGFAVVNIDSSVAPAMGMGYSRAKNISGAGYTFIENMMPTMANNPFNKKRYLGAGGAAVATANSASIYNKSSEAAPLLDDGLNAGAGVAETLTTATSILGESATSPGSGGGAVAVTKLSGTMAVTPGAGADGAVFIYARRPVR